MRQRLLLLPAGIALAAAGMTGTAGAAIAPQAAGLGGRTVATVPAGSPATFDSRAHSAPLGVTKSQAATMRSMVDAIGSGARMAYDPL
jgi:hypothetical protein